MAERFSREAKEVPEVGTTCTSQECGTAEKQAEPRVVSDIKDKPSGRFLGTRSKENALRPNSKRTFVDLNPTSEDGLNAAVESWGGTRLAIQNFGSAEGEQAALMTVKNLLREGKVVWLRATVDNEHLVNAKWLAQCCRTAHRAGVPWSMRVSATQPWSVPALMSLKKMIYVSLKKVETQAEGAYYMLVSDAVNLEHLDIREFKEQLRKRFMPSDAHSLATAIVGRE